MSRTAPARTTTRRTLRRSAVGLAAVAAAILGTVAYPSASSPATSSGEADVPGTPRAVPKAASSSVPSLRELLRGDRGAATNHDGSISEADGALPDGATPFDDEYPGVANLDPDLLQALREAAKDAADDGIEVYVNSGWRSPEYQNRLLREAVARYGSEEEAARWVATPETSAHVSGDAVDIGSPDAKAWLSQHGADYGLCQTYSNEPWHYELRPEAIGRGCPPMYADSRHDPGARR